MRGREEEGDRRKPSLSTHSLLFLLTSLYTIATIWTPESVTLELQVKPVYNGHSWEMARWLLNTGWPLHTAQLCRKYKATENFGKLSGDRNIQYDCYVQGRYIQARLQTKKEVITRLSEPLPLLENINHFGWLLLISRFPQQREVLAKRIPVKMEELVLKQKVVSSVSVKWGMEERHVQVTSSRFIWRSILIISWKEKITHLPYWLYRLRLLSWQIRNKRIPFHFEYHYSGVDAGAKFIAKIVYIFE